MAKEEEIIKELEAKGTQIVQADVNAFRESAKSVVEELFKTEWPVTTWGEKFFPIDSFEVLLFFNPWEGIIFPGAYCKWEAR
ncbi:MAG: hypothetical protein ACUVQZ_05575 [Candidatus Caldatribacteriaceae bacterium]